MRREHPSTFEVPCDADFAAIKPGDSVKICKFDERFWVTVTEVGDTILIGTVDNDLLLTGDHGLDYGDLVRFGRENVYDLIPEKKAA